MYRREEKVKRQKELDRELALAHKPLGWLERLHWRGYVWKNIIHGPVSIKTEKLRYSKYSFTNKFFGNIIDLTRVDSFGKWLVEEGLYFMVCGPSIITVMSLYDVEDLKYYNNVYVNENNCICLGGKPEGPGNWKMIFEKTEEEQ